MGTYKIVQIRQSLSRGLEKKLVKKREPLKKTFAGSQKSFEGAVRAGLMSVWAGQGGPEGKRGAMLVEQRREVQVRGGGEGKCGEHKVRQLSIKR